MKNSMRPVFYTAAELAARGSGSIPPELVSNTHLIYSSPATLAFNSPGAEGYGVKRAGLAVPESVMLIISPGCCGRNTSAISRMPGYEDRFFYLTMNETDLVTGRHLKKIPKAVEEICRGLRAQGKPPRAVMLCITCVDALLGTDMERICRRAEERVPGVRVQPCYMYALTREGRKPPMVHVRQSIYELLAPRKKRASSVNLLGFFARLSDSELPELLGQAGVRRIRQIGSCGSYDEFQEMAEANFNLVLHPEARPAAYDLQKRLGIPFIEIMRFYQIDRIEAQYAALGKVLQTSFDDRKWKKEAIDAAEAFRNRAPEAVFSVGEAMNGNPFELACALVREGFTVQEIFGTVTSESFVWINLLARYSPETRIYSNLHPTMLRYGKAEKQEEPAVTVSIGRDAGWYHPEVPNVQWITDVQPFGYRAVTGLYNALLEAVESGSRGTYSSEISLSGMTRARSVPAAAAAAVAPAASVTPAEAVDSAVSATPAEAGDPAGAAGRKTGAEGPAAGPAPLGTGSGSPMPPAGFRRFTTPFAPDQSGAVSVLYDMEGICVICDAGGCTGNICGFDEPRWFGEGRRSAVFSAGLRDMDAILGRDDRLVEKLAAAAEQIPASFASIIGTPVPAVIGTDYRALCRMAEKRTGLPVLGINTDGMEYYDRGMEKAYLALLEKFCGPAGQKTKTAGAEAGAGAGAGEREPSEGHREQPRRIGIWGFSPLDFSGILTQEELRAQAAEEGYQEVLCPGAGTSIQSLQKIGLAEKNLVLSPAGISAAKWLEKQYGTPWEFRIPGADLLPDFIGLRGDMPDKKKPSFLVVHQQVLANTICSLLREKGYDADSAGFFMMDPQIRRPPDSALREETDLRALVLDRAYDCVIADRALEPILAGLQVRFYHLPHFAVSGEQSALGISGR